MPHTLIPLRGGHGIDLIEGSRALFPALVQAIDAARHEVRLETYIFDFEGAAATVAEALERAAQRGVQVIVVVDGFGTRTPPADWRRRFRRAGVDWLVYAPLGWHGLLWPGSWRRLHRKLCVIDGHTAFCGGINVLDDFHDPNHGPLVHPRLDFAVRVAGPLVRDVRGAMVQLWQRLAAVRELRHAHLGEALGWLRHLDAAERGRAHTQPGDTGVDAALLLRDNLRFRNRIERAYLRAIGRARQEVIIASAYFVPGARMRRALEVAARRGVRVCLLVQGRYEYFMQYYAARSVFGSLLAAGVEIYEYSPSFLHAKVAVVDGLWTTVGSANLDPLSLLLAREANVVAEDRAFASLLRERLMRAIAVEGQRLDAAAFARRPRRQRLREWLALLVMRAALAIQGQRYL